MRGISEIDWLEAWYLFWCDGDWEHQYGLELRILPSQAAWKFEADLSDTQFENCEWAGLSVSRQADDWITCSADPKKFHAQGGLWNMVESLEAFRQWSQGVIPTCSPATSPSRFLSTLPPGPSSPTKQTTLLWLEALHRQEVQNDPSLEFKLSTLDNPGWELTARSATREPVVFHDRKELPRGWLVLSIENDRFVAYAGPRNLQELLEAYRLWLDGGPQGIR